jgi:hypothetical protein
MLTHGADDVNVRVCRLSCGLPSLSSSLCSTALEQPRRTSRRSSTHVSLDEGSTFTSSSVSLPPSSSPLRLLGAGPLTDCILVDLIEHKVIPSKAEEYRSAAAKHFGALRRDKEGGEGERGGPELMGSWEVVVGSSILARAHRRPDLANVYNYLISSL